MNSTYNIPVYSLFFFVLLFVLPIIIFRYLGIRKIKDLVISALRMILQLSLVGIYLGCIFKLNNYLLNIAWIFIMILIANISIIHQSGLSFRKMSRFTVPAYIFTIAFVFGCFLIIFRPAILFSARYMIPLGGMILGNLLRSNIVGLDRFFTEIKRRESEYIQYISLGATPSEALKPFLREAYRAAVAPQIGGLATMGLVALPGMMTGQILGGSTPVVAIKYQIMIMIAIFLTSTTSVFLAINLSRRSAFDEFNRFRRNIFRKS